MTKTWLIKNPCKTCTCISHPLFDILYVTLLGRHERKYYFETTHDSWVLVLSLHTYLISIVRNYFFIDNGYSYR